MKKILYIIVIVALLPLYSGCSREYEFNLEEIHTNNNNNNNNNATGTINGHEYVDLGLSVMWATCNVGANAPEDYGDYYAWGETSTKSSYTILNSETFGEDVINIKGTSRDVARVKWGGTWSMPSTTECEELTNKCEWTPTTKGGINGYRITGPNGNSIFLPAAGDRRGDTDSYDVGVKGYYWSSTNTGEDEFMYGDAIAFDFDYTYPRVTHMIARFGGLPVRPVTKYRLSMFE